MSRSLSSFERFRRMIFDHLLPSRTNLSIAARLLWAYQRVFHGEPDEENSSFREMRFTEGLVMAPLIGLIVFLGVYPKPVLDRIQPSVDQVLNHVYEQTGYQQPSVAVSPPDTGTKP